MQRRGLSELLGALGLLEDAQGGGKGQAAANAKGAQKENGAILTITQGQGSQRGKKGEQGAKEGGNEGKESATAAAAEKNGTCAAQKTVTVTKEVAAAAGAGTGDG